MARNSIASAKRIVIKIGSSSLTGSAGAALDPAAVEKIVAIVAAAKSRGAEVLVVSSGAIAAGLAPLGLSTRPKRSGNSTSSSFSGSRTINPSLHRKFCPALNYCVPSINYY